MERIMLFEENVHKMNKSNIVRVVFYNGYLYIYIHIMSNSSKKTK